MCFDRTVDLEPQAQTSSLASILLVDRLRHLRLSAEVREPASPNSANATFRIEELF
jgi:hypothetical protein